MIRQYYVQCSQCNQKMQVGKNTFYKNKKHICLKCRIKNRNKYAIGNRKLEEYICDECNKHFAMEIARKCKRDLIFGKCLCTSCSKRKDRNPFFNKHFSEEQKKILSQKRKAFYNDEQLGNFRRKEQSIKHLGKNNPMYKGIEQRSNYYTRNKTVRKKIIQRDNNLCQCCKNYFDNKIYKFIIKIVLINLLKKD